MNLSSLVNPMGAGMTLAFWWYAAVSVVALLLTRSVYTLTWRNRRGIAQLSYEFGTIAVLLCYVYAAFYVPSALEEARTFKEYFDIGTMLVGLSGIVLVVGLCCFAWAGVRAFIRRHESLWQFSFVYLVLAQVMLLQYLALATANRWENHQRWFVNGAFDTPVWIAWHCYATLTMAALFTLFAALNMVLAARATYLAYVEFTQPQRRWQQPRLKLADLFWVVVPRRMHDLHIERQLNRAIKPKNPHERTWLDNLVIVLSNMNNMQPPWGYTPGDEPDEGDGRRDANRT